MCIFFGMIFFFWKKNFFFFFIFFFLRAELPYPFSYGFKFLLIFFLKCSQVWMLAFGVFISGIVEKCHRFIIVLVPERIIRMAVTLNAAKGCTLPYFPRCIYSVDQSCNTELLIFCATFIIIHRVPVKGRGNELIV